MEESYVLCMAPIPFSRPASRASSTIWDYIAYWAKKHCGSASRFVLRPLESLSLALALTSHPIWSTAVPNCHRLDISRANRSQKRHFQFLFNKRQTCSLSQKGKKRGKMSSVSSLNDGLTHTHTSTRSNRYRSTFTIPVLQGLAMSTPLLSKVLLFIIFNFLHSVIKVYGVKPTGKRVLKEKRNESQKEGNVISLSHLREADASATVPWGNKLWPTVNTALPLPSSSSSLTCTH